MNLLKTPPQRDVVYPTTVEVEGTTSRVVTLPDAKLYARVDGDVEDTIIDMLISSSQQAFESYTSKLIFQRDVTATYHIDEYESNLWLPYLPVVGVLSVQKDGEDVDYELKDYKLEVDEFGEVEVVYTAGITDNEAPDDVKIGCLKWIVSNYDDREDLTAMGVQKMPNSSKSHWNRYKTMRT